jgi:hypothetical protein
VKSTVATALSLVAVLAAGALAAAANFRVLAGPDDAAGTSAIGAAAEVDHDEGPQTFAVGPAGSLTLDTTGGIHLVRAEPSSGWRAEPEPARAGAVVVAFHAVSGSTVVVTAEHGPDGIRVAARPVADDERDEDDD